MARITFINLAYEDIKDVLLLVQNVATKAVKLYTWLPYKPPSGKCGRYIKALRLDICRNGKFVLNSDLHPEKTTHSLHGCTLETHSMGENPPLVYNTSGTRNGILIKILTIAAKHLKMSFHKDKHEYNNNKQILVHQVLMKMLSHLTYSLFEVTPYYSQSVAVFVPRAEPLSRWPSLSRVFTWDAWLCIFFSIFSFASIFYYFSQLRGIGKSLMDAWCVLLGVSVASIPRKIPLRILFLTWVIFSLSVNTIFQNYVTSYFINPGFQHQMNTLEELSSSNFTLVTSWDLCGLFPFDRFDDGYQLLILLETFNSITYYMLFNNTALFTARETLLHYLKSYCNRDVVSKLHKFSTVSEMSDYGILLHDNSLLQSPFNKIIGRLVKAGIPLKFQREFSGVVGRTDTYTPIEYIPFSLEHLQSPFVFYLLLLCISFFVFCLELIINRLIKKYRKK